MTDPVTNKTPPAAAVQLAVVPAAPPAAAPPAAAATAPAKAESETETETETTAPAAKDTDLNMMIQFHGPRFMLGVVRAGCDPFMESMDGDLAAALQQMPAFVERAKAKWDVNPRYPKAPEPPPPPPRATTSSPGKAAAPAKPKVQPSFF